MAKIITINEKFKRVNTQFSITVCDNGFLVEMGGQDQKEDWIDRKFVLPNIKAVQELVEDIAAMPKT